MPVSEIMDEEKIVDISSSLYDMLRIILQKPVGIVCPFCTLPEDALLIFALYSAK